MNFPPFWAKGTQGNFTCWRWSHQSLAEASALAKEAVAKIAERFKGGRETINRYAYADRPLREPVLREFRNQSDEVSAVITRNSYGCLVLNTARVLFLDVDLPQPRSAGGGLFKRLFGKPSAPAPNAAEARALAKAETWAQRHPAWGWRIYRTRAGLRLMATHALFDPGAVADEPVFDELEADPLYRQLCKTQKCFRARLTPKPWRCGSAVPQTRWPWLDAKAEARFQEWEERYLKACAPHATCELVATCGAGPVHPDVQLILSVHDETTRADSKLPLA